MDKQLPVKQFFVRDVEGGVSKRLDHGSTTIEYQVKLQIVSLSLQIAVFSETLVSPFLQIGFNLFANSVSTFLQIWCHRFCKSSFNLFANEDLWT